MREYAAKITDGGNAHLQAFVSAFSDKISHIIVVSHPIHVADTFRTHTPFIHPPLCRITAYETD
jgi:hypothetical protein